MNKKTLNEKKEKVTLRNMKEIQEMGLLKNIVNVGIKVEQAFYIKKLVSKGNYKSINSFVQQAVEKKLKSEKKVKEKEK